MSYTDSGFDNFLGADSLTKDSITNSNIDTEVGDSSISLGKTTINKIQVGESIQSVDYVAGVSGWKIFGNGNAEFNDGSFRGALTSATINIPNSTTPLFSVDVDGNAVVNSLRRNDFHWFTIFESVDGYAQDLTGASSEVELTVNGLILRTGATANNMSSIYKRSVWQAGNFSFSKKRQFKTGIIASATSSKYYVGMGDCNVADNGETPAKVCFYLDSGTIYGMTADNSNYTTLSIGTYEATENLTISSFFVPGVAAYFYINGTLAGTITTTLPSGEDDFLMSAQAITTTAAAKTLGISYFDFWQES